MPRLSVYGTLGRCLACVIARSLLRSRRQAKCLTDEAEKRLVVERLHEKGKRAALERRGANRGCFPGRHHDQFCVRRYLAEPRLHLQSARLWHPHIDQSQRDRVTAGVREENLRVFEALRL